MKRVDGIVQAVNPVAPSCGVSIVRRTAGSPAAGIGRRLAACGLLLLALLGGGCAYYLANAPLTRNDSAQGYR